MSNAPKSRTSFSPASRWRIGFDVVLRTALVLAVVVMVNYLGARFYTRYYLSSSTQVKLSSRTLTVLHSLTNQVAVTLYFDRKADFYSDILGLLNEYHAINKNITIHTVDYVRDAGEAELVKEKYAQYFSAMSDKDLVIFDSNGHVKMMPGTALSQYTLEQTAPEDPHQKEMEFRRKPVAFNGELAFTAMLIALENPQPLKAYFLQDHGEGSLTDSGHFGYVKFAQTLAQNYIAVQNLELSGEGDVPMDCNLLIIAAPTKPLAEPELEKIDRYLTEGGRLLALFDIHSVEHPTGLEPILQRWGVNVMPDYVKDPEHTMNGQDVVVTAFGKHPVVDALAQLSLQIDLPRPILKVEWQKPPPNAPVVDELFATAPTATLALDSTQPPHNWPLACAIEQKPVAGAANLRGNSRIIVAGDSIFLGNTYIEGGGNRDFLNAALNWLCDRPQLLEGIGPRPVKEYRLTLTRQQQKEVRWLLLGALPGGVLVLGWLVWLVRRK
jgi:ABC-2 type transport system permease protein